ncbi:MAG TPA: glycoside hydrolase family 3, partial [Deltaproteobacteria bacterium]|nr:glycoside hydrolase family 3 [Deltaproteobacteria bacterium]
LQMKALRDRYGFEETVEKAVLAGVDILLFANNSIYDEEAPRRAAAVIASLLARGVIDDARIDRSFLRIMNLKSRMP